MSTRPAKDGSIIIVVGAGVFGLSAALHLARRGYQNVTVFDKQPLNDAPSGTIADQYRPIRCGYGIPPEYRGLGLEAFAGWNEWNEELWSGKTVPPGVTKDDRVYVNNGHLSLIDGGDTLPASEVARVKEMSAAGLASTQLMTTDQDDCDSATSRMFNIDPFTRVDRGEPNVGVLDVLGGMALADKAIRFAMHKAQGLGVRFVLDPVAGEVEELCYEAPERGRTAGVKTRDGKVHHADIVVLASGAKGTSILLPAIGSLLAITSETGVMVKIPADSELWDRLAPDNFPSWTYRAQNDTGGLLWGQPRDEEGHLKIVCRKLRTGGPSGAKIIRAFLDEFLPGLIEAGVRVDDPKSLSMLGTFDGRAVVDRVPGTRNLMVAIGRTSQDFMYLPSIGGWIVDIMEGDKLQRPAIKTWRWREPRSVGVVKAKSSTPQVQLKSKL